MGNKPRYGLVDLLWDAAFATVVLGSVLLPESSRTLLSVTLVSLGLWMLELVVTSRGDGERPSVPESRLLGVLCLIAILIELLVTVALLADGEPEVAAPFGAAALLAAASVATSRRSSPSDATLIALLGYHVVVCIPAVLLGAGAAWARLSGRRGIGEINSAGRVVQLLAPISKVCLPPLCATVMFALVVERLLASRRPTRLWQIICLAMASWVLVQAL